MGTLKPYHMIKNLFELIALKGHGAAKIWGQVLVPGHEPTSALAPEPPGETFTT